MIQEKVENVNNFIPNKETVFVIKTFPQWKTPGSPLPENSSKA